MVLAEKLLSAVQLGVANTRWRDYWDVFRLSQTHRIEGRELSLSLAEVARVRDVEMRSLSSATVSYEELAQSRWAAWLRKQGLTSDVPLEFAEVLSAVVQFADEPLAGQVAQARWDPDARQWR